MYSSFIHIYYYDISSIAHCNVNNCLRFRKEYLYFRNFETLPPVNELVAPMEHLKCFLVSFGN